MAKASQPGQTKTRLVPPLTYAQAAQLNTSFLQDAIANILWARKSAAVVPALAYAPAESESFFAELWPDVARLEAAAADLGESLIRAARACLEAGHSAVCLLNADTPDLPTEFLLEAAGILRGPGDGVVLGPTVDGGYYLIGLKQLHRALFEAMPWSTQYVFVRTRDRAAELGIGVRLLPEWDDVDDWSSLSRLAQRLRARNGRPRPFSALNTAATLQALLGCIQDPELAAPGRAAR